MHVRKPVVALTALSVLALALAGCTASTPNTTRVAESSCGSAFDAPTPLLDTLSVSGEAGELPAVTMPNPLQVPRNERKIVNAGDGALITSTSQLAHTTVWAAPSTSGEILGALGSTSGQMGQVDQWAQDLPGLAEELLCVPGGSRVLITLPTSDLAPAWSEIYKLEENQGVVLVVDVGQVVPQAAAGADVFNADRGLPAVICDTTGRPGLVIPSGDAPTEVRTQTLLKGDGEAITADVPVYVQVLAVAWRGHEPFINTWAQAQPGPVAVSQGFPADVAQALEGATVGSQVMVVLPAGSIPAEALQGSSIPADDALVYVVDILAIAQ